MVIDASKLYFKIGSKYSVDCMFAGGLMDVCIQTLIKKQKDYDIKTIYFYKW